MKFVLSALSIALLLAPLSAAAEDVKIGVTSINGVKIPPTVPAAQDNAAVTSIHGIQLPTLVPADQIAVTVAGPSNGGAGQTYYGFVTIKNVGNITIKGPLQVFFMKLPAGVTLDTATGNVSGTPYVTVPLSDNFSPTDEHNISVQFNNPSNAGLTLAPTIYAGNIK